jgi:hypothetical protein
MHPTCPHRLLLVCFSFLILSGNGLLAQSSAQAENDDSNNQVPLRMLVDYGQGKEKRRQTHRGIMEPVGLPVGQSVLITLDFSKKQAGQVVMIRPMDGGEISSQEPMVLSADGTIAFNFRTGSATGLYRLMVRAAEQYEIPLYAFDPNAPAKPRRGSAPR